MRAYPVSILRELGYRVVEAHDGISAIHLLEREDFSIDLLLTDVVMPQMSGEELADKGRIMQPQLKVLFASGYTRDAIMCDDRLQAGVSLISKPFTYATLAAQVRETLNS